MLRKSRSLHLIDQSSKEGNNKNNKIIKFNKNSSNYHFSNLSLTNKHKSKDNQRILVVNLHKLVLSKLLSHNNYNRNNNNSNHNHKRLSILIPRKHLDFLNCRIFRIYQETINSNKEVDQLMSSSIYLFLGNLSQVNE